MDPAFIVGITVLSFTGVAGCLAIGCVIFNLGKAIRNDLKLKQKERQLVEQQYLIKHPEALPALTNIPEPNKVDYNEIL
jgi:hypothetical protein